MHDCNLIVELPRETGIYFNGWEVQYLEVSGLILIRMIIALLYRINKNPHHINQQVNQVTYYGTGWWAI
jgi:hypothetical protein